MTSGIPTVKALPGFWWKSVFISGKQGNEGEQGNKDNIREKGTYENNKFSISFFFLGGGGGRGTSQEHVSPTPRRASLLFTGSSMRDEFLLL